MFKFIRERTVPFDGVASMQIFLAESLRKIQKTNAKKQAGIRTAIDDALLELDKITGTEQDPSKVAERESAIISLAPMILEPFLLTCHFSCETKQPRVCSYALDCIEKMLEYGYLHGEIVDGEDPAAAAGASMVDKAVECICECFPALQDDFVHLQIIQALLAGVTVSNSAVHDGSLLAAVRTVYNIFLNSKNETNKQTAHGHLQQMVDSVFHRMEVDGAIADDPDGPSDSTTADGQQQPVVPAAIEAAAGATPPEPEPEPDASSEAEPEAATRALDVGATAGRDAEPEAAPESEGGDSELQPEATAEVPAPLPAAASGGGSEPVFNLEGGAAAAVDELAESTFPNIYQKDAYLVFRSLCKLSMKPVPKDAQFVDSIPMRSRMQALLLIKLALDQAGPIFHGGEKFAYAIKQYLCLSLFRNCLQSPFATVFETCMEIFACLVERFADHLKTELGVFFNDVFFRVLEGPNFEFHHKAIVLSTIHNLSNKMISFEVDLYLNYDCDFDGENIFERLVNNLSKIAQAIAAREAVNEGWLTPPQAQQLQLRALESLVKCTKSMEAWCTHCDDKVAATKAAAAAQLTATTSADENDDEEDLDMLIEKERLATGRGEMGDQATRAEDSKRRKDLLIQAVHKFNAKQKNGVLFMQKHDLIPAGKGPDVAAALAKLFRETEGFDKTQIGDYMGEGGTEKTAFNVSVLHAFIEGYDFRGMPFGNALRNLLKGFRLPGEAQKIDRVVEKFSERFCSHNPGVFETADTAYTLSFSVIMLNTDLHSPMIKNKMTLEEFLRNNRGINGDGGDLPPEMLTDVYNDIGTNEIKMKDEAEDGSTLMLTQKRRQAILQHQNEAMIEKFARDRDDAAKGASKEFFHANEKGIVSLMIKVAWCPLLAAFSVIMEDRDDDHVVKLCLAGFRHAIHVAAAFGLDVERDAFVSSLTKFTNLHTSDKPIADKNVQATKSVLQIGYAEGNHLESSWGLIQRAISQLDKKLFLLEGVLDDAQLFAPDHRRPAHGDQHADQPEAAAAGTENLEYFNAQALVDQVDRNTIDRIYANSCNLNSEAIIHFFTHLCEVSMEELQGKDPRIFSLQKIVESATVNMGRVRLVWGKIWEILRKHFTAVGCHDNRECAMFAIDSLRQLAYKFLEKDELSNFNFQSEFLVPFEHIAASSKSVKIRELVICCLDQMIQARTQNLKSGWKSALNVLQIAAADPDEMIVNLGFTIAETVLHDHFEAIREVFVDITNCLVAFARNRTNTTVSLKAIQYDLHQLSVNLASGGVIELPEPVVSEHGTHVFTSDQTHLKNWFPLLTGLSSLIGDERVAVQAQALETLFRMLRMHGGKFSRELWELIFKGVLVPLFDNVRHASEGDEETDEWLQHTCFLALQELVDLFVHFYPIVIFLLRDLLDLLVSCAEQDREKLARMGVTCLTRLCTCAGSHMSIEVWDDIVNRYTHLFDRTAPKELLFPGGTVDEDTQAAVEVAGLRRREATAAKEEFEGYRAEMASVGAAHVTDDVDDGSTGSAGSPAAVEAGGVGASTATAGEGEAGGADVAGKTLGALDAQMHAAEQAALTAEEVVNALQLECDKLLRFRGVKCRCVVQLLLLDSVEEVFYKHAGSFSVPQIQSIVEAVRRCYQFATDFNANTELRNTLWKKGFMSKVPNLLRQSGNGMACLLRILFRLYAENEIDIEARQNLAEPMLVTCCEEVISCYLALSRRAQKKVSVDLELAKEIETYGALVVVILSKFLVLTKEQFARHLPRFYRMLVELILSDDGQIRAALKGVFDDLVTPLLFDGQNGLDPPLPLDGPANTG